MKLFPRVSKIGKRLVLYILLFSSLVTLILTAIQLMRDYSLDVESIQLRIDQIGVSDVPSISNDLWVLNREALLVKLNGLAALRDMQFLAILGVDGDEILSAGKRETEDVIGRNFTLSYHYREQDIALGTLYVQASLKGVYQRLLDTVIIILVSQATKTFFVSVFVLFLVHLLITRHLGQIANTVSEVCFGGKRSQIRLDRENSYWHRDDELAQVVDAINTTQSQLYDAYQEIAGHRNDLELKVRQRTRELEQMNEELKTFGYSVSHDLRSPLRSVHSFTQILVEDYGDVLDEEGNRILQRVINAAERMEALIEDLLALSRVTQRQFQYTAVDVSALCESIAYNLQQQDPDRQVEWLVAENMVAYGDKGLLEVAFHNLLGNAWKYSATKARARIECTCETRGGESVFLVRDNGVGFDMDYHDQLFEVFQRVHEGAEFEGTGIGLAIVTRVCRRHHGRVWAQAKVGEGATFYFSIPTRESLPSGGFFEAA